MTSKNEEEHPQKGSKLTHKRIFFHLSSKASKIAFSYDLALDTKRPVLKEKNPEYPMLVYFWPTFKVVNRDLH
jgi:hypothetical protein